MNYWCPPLDSLPDSTFKKFSPWDNINIIVTQVSVYDYPQTYKMTLRDAIENAQVGVAIDKISNLIIKSKMHFYS